MAAKLNERQRAFAREYIVDFNATQAAIRAGYSEKGADVRGCTLLEDSRVLAIIKAGKQKSEIRTHVTQDMVINELARLAFTDMGGLADWGGNCVSLVDSKDLSPDQLACVESVAQTANGVRLRLHSKTKALELLGRHFGMFTDKLQHSGEGITVTLVPAKEPEREEPDGTRDG